jgi:hypothetical protein
VNAGAPALSSTPRNSDITSAPSENKPKRTRGLRGELSQFTYGVVRFEHASASRLLSALPPLLCVQPWADGSGWMQSTLHLIEREARALHPGGETVITHFPGRQPLLSAGSTRHGNRFHMRPQSLRHEHLRAGALSRDPSTALRAPVLLVPAPNSPAIPLP